MKSLFIIFISAFFVVNVHAQQTEQSKEDIHNIAGLDVKPEFLGDSFQKEVVRHFVAPVVNSDIDVRAYVNFVIEKDGSISNVKCSRDPGFGIGQAAEKAVKAVTVKWKPGMQNGMPVRVAYTLPVAVKIKAPAPLQQGDTIKN